MDQICTEMHYEDVQQVILSLRQAIDKDDVWHINVNKYMVDYFMSHWGNGAFVLLSPDRRIIDCGSFMLVLRRYNAVLGSSMGWLMTKNDGIKLFLDDHLINNAMFTSALDDTLSMILVERDQDNDDLLVHVHPLSNRVTVDAKVMVVSSLIGGDTYLILQYPNP